MEGSAATVVVDVADVAVMEKPKPTRRSSERRSGWVGKKMEEKMTGRKVREAACGAGFRVEQTKARQSTRAWDSAHVYSKSAARALTPTPTPTHT